jgi:lipopolysaccharide/colanic/teichoic acid biosynthesis glycosyltransferase
LYDIVKRLVDIVFATLLIVILSPLLILAMIILRFTGEREVFYLQKRIGYRNKYFNIYKFATMVKDSPNIGTKSITLRNDPRVTTFGKYLRMSKLNELPQLFNILLGQMTLIGPRPFVDATFEAYPSHVQKRVYDIRPGLTGAGSIVYRDEEEIISNSEMSPAQCYREVISPHKGELELWYQTNRSHLVDIKLLFLTAVSVLLPGSGTLFYKFFPSAPRPSSVVEQAVTSE